MGIDRRIDTVHLNDRAAVHLIQNSLHHSGSRHTGGTAKLRVAFGIAVVPLVERRTAGQIAVGRHTAGKIGGAGAGDTEHGAVDSRWQIIKIQYIIVSPRTSGEHNHKGNTE